MRNSSIVSGSDSQSAPLFAAFQRIRIVNLASRTDRRAEMEQQLARVGMAGDPRVAFFPALSFDDPGLFLRTGSRGNFEGRVALFKEAAAAGESLLIFEDDCDFYLPAIMEYRLPESWDIFYGGFSASDTGNLQDSDIIGSHFMGFSVRAVQLAADYLERYLEPDFPADPLATQDPGFNPAIRPPIDGAFVWFRRAYPELVTVFAMLGGQRPSRTDVGDQHPLDRLPIVRNFMGLARKVRRVLTGR